MRFKTYPFLRLLLLLEIMSLCACTIDDGEAYPENEWVRLTATIAPLSEPLGLMSETREMNTFR